jgi:hypothetical protein
VIFPPSSRIARRSFTALLGTAALALGSSALLAPSTAAAAAKAVTPLPAPSALVPFVGSASTGAGKWASSGRAVDGVPAVYETALVPPGGTTAAGIAWMDTRLLTGRLYSGSKSPGGGPYHYTAPIEPAQAAALVAAFNGGFQMTAAGGGYYTEGRVVVPLRAGAASLVIYANGNVTVGDWGSGLSMTSKVVEVEASEQLLTVAPTAPQHSPSTRFSIRSRSCETYPTSWRRSTPASGTPSAAADSAGRGPQACWRDDTQFKSTGFEIKSTWSQLRMSA